MANPTRLQVSGLPAISAQEQANALSPARGAEMTNFLRARLTGRRNNTASTVPPLVHSWCFWHDRQERAAVNSSSSARTLDSVEGSGATYEDRLEPLADIRDVKDFWSVFNNFDIAALALRDSIHLFHKGIKPVWEDARNARGGSWTFRVPIDDAPEFWKEVCMMAIGEVLQTAVEDPGRDRFLDDICGISLGVRTRAVLVQIWNRDAEHEQGIERIKDTIVENLSQELRPKEDRLVYYKKHSEHAGFGKKNSSPLASSTINEETVSPTAATSGNGREMQSLDAIMKDI